MDSPQQLHISLDTLAKRADALLADLAEVVEKINSIRKAKSPDQINVQLKAIGDAIRKLERQGVPIPDDLRRVKISLTSDLGGFEEVERIRAKVSEQLSLGLAQLGTSYYYTIQAASQVTIKGKKKKAQDDNVLDLFGWKKSAGGSNP